MRWRVVHGPRVAVRATPGTSGRMVATKAMGAIVASVVERDGWIRLQEAFEGGEGWMLVDGAVLGLGALLERVAPEVDAPVVVLAHSTALRVKLPGILPPHKLEVLVECSSPSTAVSHVFQPSRAGETVLLRGLRPGSSARLYARLLDRTGSAVAASPWVGTATLPRPSGAGVDVFGVRRGACRDCDCGGYARGDDCLHNDSATWCCSSCGCAPERHCAVDDATAQPAVVSASAASAPPAAATARPATAAAATHSAAIAAPPNAVATVAAQPAATEAGYPADIRPPGGEWRVVHGPRVAVRGSPDVKGRLLGTKLL